ncbi:MAG TPA: ABC transporter permease [Vicinamibacterales bacterium]|nr:ABC transporter permease [Vicinamibacterales bacterium]
MRGSWSTELRWVWRNVRARGLRGTLTVALLAVALAANTVVFSVADSLVFRRVTFPESHRLVNFETRDATTGRPGGGFGSAAVLDEWRKQADLFAGVHGHLYKTIFLTGSGEAELVQTADVTVGLVEMLGVRPRWGRSFVEEDQRRTDVHAVLLAESLARERFGDPARAVDQRLETTGEPLLVVGVMPDSFRFPGGSQRIWRVFDPRGPLARNMGISLVARIAPGMSFEHLTDLMRARSEGVLTAAGGRAGSYAVPVPLRIAQASDDQRRLLLLLLGAAVSLLLLACANVASLELATALGRAKTYAVQLAVGASRGALVRTALAEGACLVGVAALVAAALAEVATTVLVRHLPASFTASLNPIDVDARALAGMAGFAAFTWMASSLPVLLYAWRADLIALLKLEGQSVGSSRGGSLGRRALTVVQVSLAVVLLVGGVLYVRSYLALLRIEKGFDSSGVAAITLTIPPQSVGPGMRALAQTVLERVRQVPGVLAAFEGSPPPSTGDSPTRITHIEVDDRPPAETDILLPRLWVDPDYFAVLRIPLLAGRMLEPGDPPSTVLITEALARRLWPGENPVGRRFRESPDFPWNEVVGVVGHVRTIQDGTTGPERYFQRYSLRQPPPPPPPGGFRPILTGASYGFITVTARVDSRERAADVFQAVRAIDTRNILKVEFVDDQYARQFADRLLATRVVTGFGVLAFVVAAAGIYGLMAFLVAERTREIGIRLALGADAGRINRLVLGSALRLAGAGALIGIGGALAASRWVQSQLFGVSPTDPATIGFVTLGVVVSALAATVPPARQAARVDPTVLLKN